MHVPLTVRDFLDRAELVYGDRVGLVDEPDQPARSWGALSYRELAVRARSFAACLDTLGLRKRDRVAIVSPNAARFVAALYGTCISGRVLVPINFRLHAHEIAYIVEHSGARVLLVDPELETELAGVKVEHKFVFGERTDPTLFGSSRTPDVVDLAEDDLATLNYTSGTTARPKGVMLTHRNLWMNATTFGWHAGVNDRDRFLHVVPIFHCNGWGMPFALAAMGATQVILRRVSGAEILRRVESHGITFLGGAPAVLSGVLDAQTSRAVRAPGHGTTRVLVAGAPPPTNTIERVETELGWEIIQLYGLTETSPLITINRVRAEYDALSPSERAAKLGRAGAPVIGSRIRVDEQGEVLSRSNVVMDGYWNDRAATEAAIVDGWFHTGDGGSLDEGGYLSISDRKKDVIISGGENVSSIEVEDCLMSHPSVAEAAVIGVPDEKWGETVKALVVLRPGVEANDRALIDHCRAHLAHYKCPTSVEFRETLARTATGKLQKFVLRAPYWAGRSRQVN
ncbi:MAG: AMP-binding protein [Planctomycetota bacterium]|nr:AMP-binding protein [Planctomycetota bacterium]